MTSSLTINLLRTLFVIFAFCIGMLIGDQTAGGIWVGAAVGLIAGLVIILTDRLLKGIALRTFSSATFGLIIGLIASRLLLASNILKYQSEEVQWVSSLVLYASAGYLGMMLAVRSSRDEFSLIIPYVRFRQAEVQDVPIVVDTNVIIDGRLPDICATGFLTRSLIISRSVLDELQRLADSAEPLKREKGRRGLDTLNQMQKNPALHIRIHEGAVEDEPVDTILVNLAKMLGARLLTNDSSLCKIARLRNVTVLNLSELAQAMRPTISAGDELEIMLVKEGREPHQAVGYMPDGTMIVVNQGHPFIGKSVTVTVAGTLQTAAGRLFFAEVKQT